MSTEQNKRALRILRELRETLDNEIDHPQIAGSILAYDDGLEFARVEIQSYIEHLEKESRLEESSTIEP